VNRFSKAILEHKYIRFLLPVLIIIVWLVIAGVGGPSFGKIGSVESNNQANFLPASAESTKVQTIQNRFYKSDTLPAVILVTSPHKLNPQELGSLSYLKPKLASARGVSKAVASVIGPIPSHDGRAVEFVVQIKASANISKVVKNLKQIMHGNVANNQTYYVTGPAGLSSALMNAFSGIDGILLIVALGAVFVILLLVYRSIILPVLVLLMDIFALSGAILVVFYLAKGGSITLNGESQGILSILVIGASTDYSLLLISRYRESLGQIQSKWQALFTAFKSSIEPIAASAATVVLALLCLLFSDLRSNKSLGPVAAIGIIFAFLAAISFLPALLSIFGRVAFWPMMPKYEQKSDSPPTNGFWQRISGFVSRYPRRIWIVASLILVVCALGLTQLRASGVSSSATILAKSDAVTGQKVLAKHFPAGSGAPVIIVAPKTEADQALAIVNNQAGLKDTSFYTANGKTPVVKDNQVLITATTTTGPSSQSAQETVKHLRADLKQSIPDSLVGGQTAIMLDTNTTARQDLLKIIPIVLVVVFIVLALLLRALLAPLLLVASVILSYAATLGVSAMVFNHLFHFPGADPAVPLFGFIFLVALGIDYNIFLMSRVREEAKRMATRPAILRGLTATGGVITSAGVVLAATFAALGVIPILFLAELAFIVSFGVLLDTIVVRSLIVPSITYDIGKKIWWPSKLDKSGK